MSLSNPCLGSSLPFSRIRPLTPLPVLVICFSAHSESRTLFFIILVFQLGTPDMSMSRRTDPGVRRGAAYVGSRTNSSPAVTWHRRLASGLLGGPALGVPHRRVYRPFVSGRAGGSRSRASILPGIGLLDLASRSHLGHPVGMAPIRGSRRMPYPTSSSTMPRRSSYAGGPQRRDATVCWKWP